jgi:hypothetical protein
MKKREVVTLNQIFSSKQALSFKKLKDTEWPENLVKIKEDFTREFKLFWPGICAVFLKKIMEVLNVPVADVMVDAWNKCREIMQYADLKKYPPDKTYMVPLAEHEIPSKFPITLEIYVNNQKVCELIFDVKFSLILGGIILEIKGGRIMKLHSGSFKGKGSIMYQDMVVFDQKTSPFTLPGVIDLGEGVPIPKIAA